MGRQHLPISRAQIRRFIRDLGGGGVCAAAYFRRVLTQRNYSSRLAGELLALARGTEGDRQGTDAEGRWQERHIYALLLEHLASKIAPGDLETWGEFLDGLGLMAKKGLRPSLRREGYSTLELAGFAPEFAGYLSRNAAWHRQLEQAPGSVLSQKRFLHLARQSCRCLLARYLFRAEEVVERILAQVRSSEGLPSTFLSENADAVAEADRALSNLPEFESKILSLLLDRHEVFWVALDPDCSLNALVEYPLTTVVLVVKPPGSSVEFEIKRAGHPEANPLRVSYGDEVPGHHRLDGGGYGLGLRWEALAGSHAARTFRAAHGEDLSLSVPVSVQLVHSVPSGDQPVYILSYFTDPTFFGAAYDGMRHALRSVVEAFKREGDWKLPDAPDEFGRTNEFMIQTKPAQAVLVGSSSFRVDKVEEYLTPEGLRAFLRAVPGPAPRPVSERLLVDTVLAEILGQYQPPDSQASSIEDYLEAAFASPANQQEASRTYRSLLSQLADFWGTLLAWGASSRGESTVARNVGLRCVWHEGQWPVRVIFMDHDQLNFYTGDPDSFHPRNTLPSIRIDEEHLVSGVSGPPAPRNRSLLNLLGLIYRQSPSQCKRGRALFRTRLTAAYRATRREQLSGDRLVGFPGLRFIESLGDWEDTVSFCLRARQRGVKDWRKSVRRALKRRGRQVPELGQFLDAFEQHAGFLRRYACLYRTEDLREGLRDSAA